MGRIYRVEGNEDWGGNEIKVPEISVDVIGQGRRVRFLPPPSREAQPASVSGRKPCHECRERRPQRVSC